MSMAAFVPPLIAHSYPYDELEAGCSLTSEAEGSLKLFSSSVVESRLEGYAWGSAAPIGQPAPEGTPSFYDPSFLNAFGEILVGLSRLFGERPSFEFYDDGDKPNAKASSRSMPEVAGTKGSVYFGLNMLEGLLKQEGGDMAVFAIAAHEFAHIYQFHNGWAQRIRQSLPSYYVELHADYLAGFSMAHYVRAYPAVKVRNVAIVWKAIGSRDFNDPGTHGTSEQRLNAIEAGYDFVKRSPKAKISDAALAGFNHLSR